MHKMSRVVCVLILVLFACAVGCTAPSAEVRQVSLQSISLQQLDFDLTLDFFNPNKIAVPVDGIDWGLALFGIDVANGSANPDEEIPAEGSTEVAVPITVSLAETADAARHLVSAREIPWNVDGTCRLRVAANTVEVDFSRAGNWENPLR